MSDLNQDGQNEAIFVTQTQDLNTSKPSDDDKENEEHNNGQDELFTPQETEEMTPPFFDLFNQGNKPACRHCGEQPCQKYELKDEIEGLTEQIKAECPDLAPKQKRFKVYRQLALYRGWAVRTRHEPCVNAAIRKIFARRPSDPAYKGHVYK
mmetsp:Transcript_8636/g.12497  ORF Transcript_8636/g.12497 Transcript_8636/m.12497 type:complete len:152 (+) Transcript_8636:1919-2374(+)